MDSILVVFKLVTFCYDCLNSYMNFNDTEGVYSFSFLLERKPDCLACKAPKMLKFSPESKLSDVITYLKNSAEFHMVSPTIMTVENGRDRRLFMDLPGMVDDSSANLVKTLRDLGLVNGQTLFISDVTTTQTLTFSLIFLKTKPPRSPIEANPRSSI